MMSCYFTIDRECEVLTKIEKISICPTYEIFHSASPTAPLDAHFLAARLHSKDAKAVEAVRRNAED